MSGNRVNRKHWIDWFPIEAELLSGSQNTTDSTLLVDVGGSKGHDLERFLDRYPESRGRLVLQDLPGVVEKVEGLSEGIQVMAHDFFTPQPIKGIGDNDLGTCLHTYVLQALVLITHISYYTTGRMRDAEIFFAT